MATFFKNKLLQDIGTTEEQVVAVGTSSRVTIIGLSLTNKTGDIVYASVRLENTDEGSEAYYIKDTVVPPNQSLRVVTNGEKLVLAGDMNMYVNSSAATSLDLVASYVEIV